jgi:hypothetical protein
MQSGKKLLAYKTIRSGIGSLLGGGQQLPEIEALPEEVTAYGKIMGYSEMIDAGLWTGLEIS